MTPNTRLTRIFIGLIVAAGLGSTLYSGLMSHTLHLYYALAVLVLAAATSRMKVKLPGIDGNMSVNLPFLLIAVLNLSSAEAIAITCISTAVQCWPRRLAQFKPQQMAFNVGMMSLASGLASLMFHAEWLRRLHWNSATPGLVLATLTLFLGQTAPVATIVALSEGKAVGHIWLSLVHLSFPYYAVSAGLSSMVQTVSSHAGWQLALAVFPVMYGIYRSYQLYFGKAAEAPQPPMLARAASAR